MNNNKVLLLLNGEAPNSLPDVSDYEVVCGTDGAYELFRNYNVTPQFISGDFDSLDQFPEDVECIPTPNQDFTDFDKILKILFDRGYYHIHVFGASGKEQDHFMGNLHTALQWENRLNLTFFDNYGYYFLAKPNQVITGCFQKHVSLVPMPKVEGVITKGLKYSLNNEPLVFGTRIGTRNVALVDKVEITFLKGNLFVFIND